MPDENESPNPSIVLATGYEVEIEEGYENHLCNAILGEIVLNPANEGVYDLDTGLRLALSECDRISATYNIPYNALIRNFFRNLEKVMEKVERTSPKGSKPKISKG